MLLPLVVEYSGIWNRQNVSCLLPVNMLFETIFTLFFGSCKAILLFPEVEQSVYRGIVEFIFFLS